MDLIEHWFVTGSKPATNSQCCDATVSIKPNRLSCLFQVEMKLDAILGISNTTVMSSTKHHQPMNHIL